MRSHEMLMVAGIKGKAVEMKGTLIFRMRQCERLGWGDGGGWEKGGAGVVGARKDAGNVQGRLHPK